MAIGALLLLSQQFKRENGIADIRDAGSEAKGCVS